MKPPRATSYWHANLRLVAALLLIWFVVAYVGSIFLIDWLNTFPIGYLGFGFWLAQQGSIYVFIGLVLVYALWMDRLDRYFDVGD